MALRTPLSVTPHLYMGDSTGRPLDKGVVYFGEQDKDPEFYPINLFSDDELTKPLMQPVHTKGGYLYDKGDMVEPHAKELIYSVKVLDSYGRKVFYKGAMMRNSWNDDVIEQINAAIVASTDIARQVATDITNDAINNTAVEGGVLADTFVTMTANRTGAVARTLRDVNLDIINVKDFGAKGDGVTDDTDAFEAMTAYVKTLTDSASILIPMGEYKVTRHIMFDMPSHSVLDCHGVIASTLLSDVLVTVGSAEVAKLYYDIRGLDVKYKGTNTVWSNINQDTNGTSVAVRLLNVCLSTVHIRQARFCYTGLWLDGSLPSGSLAYNDIYINNLKDNVVCLLLKPSTDNGYVNENTIYGGAYGHSGSFPFTGNEVDIKFEPFGGLSLNVNNNLIFRPSLESNSLASIAASIAGKFNQIYMPRMENPKNSAFPIIFETNSEICSVKGGGWSLTITNITDLGRGNSYETQSGNVTRNSGRSEDISAFTYQNISSNFEKALGVLNSSELLTFWVNGVGDVYSRGSGYFRTGMRWFSTDGTNNDRGLFVASGEAASTSAARGSLHVSTNTGKISIKESGSDGTGWRTLQYIVARATAPTGYEVGQHYFNTTLGKPVWWNGTDWVDSAGVAV